MELKNNWRGLETYTVFKETQHAGRRRRGGSGVNRGWMGEMRVEIIMDGVSEARERWRKCSLIINGFMQRNEASTHCSLVQVARAHK